MPDHRIPLPCGAWPSPVSPALVAGKTVTLSSVTVDGDAVFWLERRPAEAGRSVLMRWTEQEGTLDVTTAPQDVGTRVHEYGGGGYAVLNGVIVFSDRLDNGLWLLEPGKAEARRIAGAEGMRYADPVFEPGGKAVFAIREDHTASGQPEATLIRVALSPGHAESVLVRGPDFLSSPAPSPIGSRLAWVEWDHPSMPWEATRLCVARLDREEDGSAALSDVTILAGAEGHDSLIEPRWADDAILFAGSDRSGWWNLLVFEIGSGQSFPAAPMEAEIGQPHWVFGQRSFSLLADGRILALAVAEGRSTPMLIGPEGVEPVALGSPEQCPVPLGQDRFAWLDAPPGGPQAVVIGRIGEAPTVLRAATVLSFGADDIALAEVIRFSVPQGGEGHAFFYPPTSATACVPEGELPPMIVTVHGGPTARASDAFSFKVQWWTSRGFSVLDVNYGGSTGFGRAWRQRLDGQWGVVDVVDCIAAAEHMAASGRVDPRRIAIRGSSAGGLTVLASLARSELFAAGTSLYGVTDLRALAQETHKFESRYLDGLIGPWPEAESLYLERSPLTLAGSIRAPVLFLQGLEDKVVPPAQAQAMARALAQNHVQHALYEFEGEGHGFRAEMTIRRALELELDFYGQVFGFTPAGDPERVTLLP